MFAYRPPLPSTPQSDYTTSWNRSIAIFLCLNRMMTTPHLKTSGKKKNKSTQVNLKCSVYSCPDRSYITIPINAMNIQTTNTHWQTTSLEFDTLLCGKNTCCDDAKSPVATVAQLSYSVWRTLVCSSWGHVFSASSGCFWFETMFWHRTPELPMYSMMYRPDGKTNKRPQRSN